MYNPFSIMSENKQDEVQESNRKINERIRKVINKINNLK